MLRVTVELDSAITGETTTLGVMCIANSGEGTRESGNYLARVVSKRYIDKVKKGHMPYLQHTLRLGEVKNYPRLTYNVWRLVLRSLRSAFPEEK